MSTLTDGLSEVFLEGELQEALSALTLDRCPRCGSLWCADGRRDERLLSGTYAALPDAYFAEVGSDREDYRRLYRSVAGHLARYTPGRRVCDLGCGDGRLLAYLGEGWERYGIEPSRRGVELARKRGLEVYQGTLATCPELCELDAMAAIDVVEHLLDPLAAFEAVRARLRPGGILVAVTGDASAWTARRAGPHWFYLRWAGHVSVLSSRGLCGLLERAGFTIERSFRCDHPASPGALAWLRAWGLEPLRRILGRPPSWLPYWRDHQLVVARSGKAPAPEP